MLVLCGGANKSLAAYLFNYSDPTPAEPCSLLYREVYSAPPLMIDVNGPYYIVALMDGAVSVRKVNTLTRSYDVILDVKDHTKPTVAVKFTPEGTMFASGSYDKTVALYRCNNPEDDPRSYTKIAVMEYATSPESLVFAPHTQLQSDGPQEIFSFRKEYTADRPETFYDLIISLRDVAHLVYVDCSTMSTSRVSLNESDWNTHVSFTALHLSLSPNMKVISPIHQPFHAPNFRT